MERLAPLYARLGLQPQRPTQWCEDFAAQFEALVALRPAVANFTFGILDAARWPACRRLPGGGHSHHRGRRAPGPVWGRCSVRQRHGSRGHRGTFPDDFTANQVGTLALVPQCVDAVDIRSIAAGGIAWTAGALQLHRRWARRPCRWARPFWRARNPASAPRTGRPWPRPKTPTRGSPAFSPGRPARGIVNAMMEALAAEEDRVPAYPVQNALTGALRRAAAAQGAHQPPIAVGRARVGAARPVPAARTDGVAGPKSGGWLQPRLQPKQSKTCLLYCAGRTNALYRGGLAGLALPQMCRNCFALTHPQVTRSDTTATYRPRSR